MEDLEYVFNELKINDKYKEEFESINPSVIQEVIEHIESIPFIKWLCQPDDEREYAKDKERDYKGRIKVDITKPHLLEDTDYFRERALYFQKHGKYTNLYPNRHPNSEYMLFWKEEERRCLEGYVRENDGEWIPGYYYFYLNYSPIIKTIDILDEFGNKTGRGDRVYEFADFWDSDYLFFHYVEQSEEEGLFGTALKTRGRGYSFKGASLLNRNYFFIRKSKSFAFASDSEYLEDDGLLNNKAWDNMDWIDEHTPWRKSRLKDTILSKQAGYIDPEDKKKKGYKSQILGVTTGGNPEKGRGKRGKILLFEEGGIFPHLLKTWSIARASLEDGGTTFGFMLAWGTGGTVGANFEGIEELFYHGDGYRVKMLNNVFDKNQENGKCAFYVGEYMNRKNCYDNNGNSNPVKALVELFIDRQKIRLNATNSDALTQECAERSITPQEAMLRVEGSIFPTSDLKSYLEYISPSLDSFLSEHYVGELAINPDTGEVTFKTNADLKVVREFPMKDNKNKEGAVEIFKMPIKSPSGEITRFRYIGGIDTYDDDESGTNSLGSIQIFDMLTDEIVAEYTGRPKSANTFYEICFRLLKFYNAIANYENDKKGLFGYFSHKHALTYLCDVPEILKDTQMIKGTNLSGNKSKGTNSNTKINAWGRRLQADWMISKVEGEEEKGTLQLQRLRSPAYIKECIGWNENGNFDRVSSGGMLFILREEYKKYIYFIKDEQNKEKTKTLANDPFFELNYRGDKKATPLEIMILKEKANLQKNLKINNYEKYN